MFTRLWKWLRREKVTVTEITSTTEIVQGQQNKVSIGLLRGAEQSKLSNRQKTDLQMSPVYQPSVAHREEYLRRLSNRNVPVAHRPLGNIRAVQKMKHGHQALWYRKTVKSNIQVEEDDN